MARNTILAAIVLSALCGLAAGQWDSTGWEVEGFTLASNVTGHLFLSKDACDIKALAEASPINFTAINAIYRNGANAIRPDGRTARYLASWTSGAHATGHPYYGNASALFNDTNWIGNFMDAALMNPDHDLSNAQRAIMAVHTTSLQLPLSYLLAELYAIADEINPNGTADGSTGAPHALDEGYAVYVGNVSTCSPWDYANDVAVYFGTHDGCRSRVNRIIVEQFNIAQAATFSGNVSQYVRARDEIIKQLQVMLVQNVIFRAYAVEELYKSVEALTLAAVDANTEFLLGADVESMSGAVNASVALAITEALFEAARADAYSLYRALGPFLYMYAPMTAHALDHYFDLDTPVSRGYAAQVVLAIQNLYDALGVSFAQVGLYSDEVPTQCASHASRRSMLTNLLRR